MVEGDRRLPPGFAHTHASEEARAIAEAGTILRVQVGVSRPQLPTIAQHNRAQSINRQTSGGDQTSAH